MGVELEVIIPVYNEAAVIGKVITQWLSSLNQLEIQFKLTVINDGSTDETLQILERSFSQHAQVFLVNQANQGHGPTLVKAYQAVQAEWVFQVDSDNEMTPEAFATLWRNRHRYDLLLGQRQGRASTGVRFWISWGCRVWVGMLFGTTIYDINVPYRLFRKSVFQPVLNKMSPNTFAPNVLISACATGVKARVWTCKLTYSYRKTGQVSIRNFKLVKGVMMAFIQTLWFRLKQ